MLGCQPDKHGLTFPGIKLISVVAGCCEACGQPPTCGQGGGNAWRFPRLVHRGPRWRGQAGIGAADCPQIHGTSLPWRQAASAVAAVARCVLIAQPEIKVAERDPTCFAAPPRVNER